MKASVVAVIAFLAVTVPAAANACHRYICFEHVCGTGSSTFTVCRQSPRGTYDVLECWQSDVKPENIEECILRTECDECETCEECEECKTCEVCEDCPTCEECEECPLPIEPDPELVGGGGCSVDGGTAGGALGALLLIGLLFFLRAAKKLTLAGLFLVASVGSADARTLRLDGDLITVKDTVLRNQIGMTYDYSHRPLRVVKNNRGSTIYNVIDGRHSLLLRGSIIAIEDRLQFGFNLPVVLRNAIGDETPIGNVANSGIGNLELTVKARLFDIGRFSFGVSHELAFPTATSGSLIGTNGATFHPEGVVTWSNSDVQIALNFGFLVKPLDDSIVFGPQRVRLKDAFTAGLGARFYGWRGKNYSLNFLAEADLSVQLAEQDEEEVPLEVLGGIELETKSNWAVLAGIGVGLTRGFETPVVRPFVGVSYRFGVCPKQKPCQGAPCRKIIYVERVKTIYLPTVYFDTDKATLRPVGKEKLTIFAQSLKANPQITKIRIEGHTDHRASKKYNQKLSERRVASVVAFLSDLGIRLARIETRSYGENQRIDTSKTKNGMQLNRRVELLIKSVK